MDLGARGLQLPRWRGKNDVHGRSFRVEEPIEKALEMIVNMKCVICNANETDNPDGICDDCKFSIISLDDIPPNF